MWTRPGLSVNFCGPEERLICLQGPEDSVKKLQGNVLYRGVDSVWKCPAPGRCFFAWGGACLCSRYLTGCRITVRSFSSAALLGSLK